MNIIIKEYTNYNENKIVHLYNSVGWMNYTTNLDMLKNAFSNSLKILGAYIDKKLIGIIRVVGDGYSIVYIQDLLVLPKLQRQEIGSLLLKEILKEYHHVYQKVLITDNTEKTIAFYKSIAFIQNRDIDCCAFILLNQ